MVLFVSFTRWLSYVRTQEVEATLLEEAATDNLKQSEAEYLIAHPATTENKVTKIKAEMAADEAIVEAVLLKRRASALRRRLGVQVDHYDRCGALLSRELTRRTAGGNTPIGRQAASENGGGTRGRRRLKG